MKTKIRNALLEVSEEANDVTDVYTKKVPLTLV